jgi:hypothetical protein
VALDTDHRGLNKFQSSDDPNWQIFLRVLHQARDHALQQCRLTLASSRPWTRTLEKRLD